MNRNELPARLAARPFDTRRGLPIPYVSEHTDGSIDFSLINGTRVLDCVRRGLCSACGQPHEPQLAFVGGPGGFRQRRYTDAPMHLECAHWSLRLCPYLALERRQRRGHTEQTAAPGFTQMEKADPVILAVTTGCRVELLHEPGYAPTVQFRPAPWTFASRCEYRHGRLTEVGPQPLPYQQKTETKPMTLYQVTVYHNDESRFMPYDDGQRLTATVSHWSDRPDAAPLILANWAWHVFNADLDMLENNRTTPDGETGFLLACVYRLLGLRSLSVGDVIEISTSQDHWWLACDPDGWRHISPPTNIGGQPLTAEKVYQHLHSQRRPR